MASSVKVSYDRPGLDTFDIRPTWLEEVRDRNNGSCWHDSFTHVVLSSGFKVPNRHPDMGGIEVPFWLLTELTRVKYPLPYLDSFALKGADSAVLPVKHHQHQDGRSSVQWHYTGTSRKTLDMLDVLSKNKKIKLVAHNGRPGREASALERLVYNMVSESNRHFLGMYESAELHVGTNGARVDLITNTTRNTNKVKPLEQSRILWMRNLSPSIGFSFPPVSLGLSTNFNMQGGTTSPIAFQIPRTVEAKLDISVSRLMMLYDAPRRIAWIVPEICAILHLIKTKAAMTSYRFDFPEWYDLSPGSIKGEVMDFISPARGDTSAQDLFVLFHDMIRQMIEKIVLDRSGSHISIFDWDRLLVGADFYDMVNCVVRAPCKTQPLQASIGKTNGMWVKLLRPLAEERHFPIATLMCENLNPPPVSRSPAWPTCGHWDPIPTGHDYLVLRGDSLLLLIEAAGNLDPPMLSPVHYWIRSKTWPPVSGACPGGERCNVLQRISKDRPNWNEKGDLEYLRQNLNMAFIFGESLP